jgi:hypothetical protein
VFALQQQQLLQQQQAGDPDNSQLAALLAAMEDPSSRWAAAACSEDRQGYMWSMNVRLTDVPALLLATETRTCSSSVVAVCTHAQPH